MLCDVGRLDQARKHFAIEAADGFEYPYNAAWLAGMLNVTDAAATLRDRDACQSLIERLTPFAGHVVCAGQFLVLGALARPLARAATVLGDYDQAEEWFATAHDIHTRLQAPFWTALGLLDHADLCLFRGAEGDLERARALATMATSTAAEYGCEGLTKRSAKLLAEI
jgi:tetratricopeptide (TPR) repeat protein